MLRAAGPGDANAIARVVVESWRATYPGMIPQDFLDRMDAAELSQRWSRRLSDPLVGELTFVIEEAGRVVGFASGGPDRDGGWGGRGELYAIYLVPEAQGRGWGRALVIAVAEGLLARGITSMVVWALRANHRARGFYERLGGTYLRERLLDFGAGFDVVEVGYGWEDVRSQLATAS
jgi:GNAT superfamily N-acetyltransferase